MIANDYITEKVNIAYKEITKSQLVLSEADWEVTKAEAKLIKEYLEYAKKNIEVALQSIYNEQ